MFLIPYMVPLYGVIVLRMQVDKYTESESRIIGT